MSAFTEGRYVGTVAYGEASYKITILVSEFADEDEVLDALQTRFDRLNLDVDTDDWSAEQNDKGDIIFHDDYDGKIVFENMGSDNDNDNDNDDDEFDASLDDDFD
jgi:hypothetical protein